LQSLELAPRDVNRDSANERHGREKGPEVPNGKVRGDETAISTPNPARAATGQAQTRYGLNSTQYSTMVRPFPAGENVPWSRIAVLSPEAAQNPASSARPGRTNGRNRWLKRCAHSAGERGVVKLRLEEITNSRLADSSDKVSVCFAVPAARRNGSGLCDLPVLSGAKIGIARVASTEF